MKGKWKVYTNIIGGERMYQVCRIRNTAEVVHAGNLETNELYGDKAEAQKVVDELNAQEENEDEGR